MTTNADGGRRGATVLQWMQLTINLGWRKGDGQGTTTMIMIAITLIIAAAMTTTTTDGGDRSRWWRGRIATTTTGTSRMEAGDGVGGEEGVEEKEEGRGVGVRGEGVEESLNNQVFAAIRRLGLDVG